MMGCVINPAKRAEAKGLKPHVIKRKVFRGDPGLTKYDPKPTPFATSRYTKPEYEANKARRKMQQAPAAKSTTAHKGPTHRPGGLGREAWCKLMAGK
jgi:hypothetical protein